MNKKSKMMQHDDDDDVNKQDASLFRTRPTCTINEIRAACEDDTEAIIQVETTSFPDVYTDDVGELIHRRRDEIEGGYPCCRILEDHGRLDIHGVVMLESYLRRARKYRDSETGEEIVLPANRPPDRKPANDILMAAIRADPSLLHEEFLFISEICIHPRKRGMGNGTRLMRHVTDIVNQLAVKVIVLVEGSVSDAAKKWTACEGEEVDMCELSLLRGRERRSIVPFYQEKLGFRSRAHFFWGRRNYTIPRIFHVMQYPSYTYI
ncbi:hypothetical protein GGS20DRAFT_516659 [Poronia punctata]|nr:hypothetical protein GGS20DRAFT_516659 [Poronia punctata]